MFSLQPSLRLGLVVLVALASVEASVAASPPGGVFVDRVEVDVVDVEVTVVDREGRRVPGLRASDFELYEDGERVEISNFYAAARGQRPFASLDGGAVLHAPAAPGPAFLPPERRLHLVVYVDHYNLSPLNKKRVLDQLSGFLGGRLAQGDRVTLVGYDGELRTVTPPTDDRRAVEEGLAELARYSTHRQVADAERRRAMVELRLIADGAGGMPVAVVAGSSVARDRIARSYDQVLSYIQQARLESRRSTAALARVVRSLAGVPGRKAVFYVSEGLAERPGEDLHRYFEELWGAEQVAISLRGASHDVLAASERPALERIVHQANASQVTLYTVDARLPAAASGLTAAYGAASLGPGGRLAVDPQHAADLEQPLLELAERTGGRAILGTAGVERALAEAALDLDVFYSLGYRRSAGAGDGRYRELEVEVKRPGLEVRHRRGYVAKPQEERIADRTYSSLFFDLAENPLEVEVELGTPERSGRGRYEVPILIRVPMDRVSFVPRGERHQGRLRFFVAVRGEDGRESPVRELPHVLTLTAEELAAGRGREIGYATRLELRPGRPRIAIGVWDELAGTESFIHKGVVIGDRG